MEIERLVNVEHLVDASVGRFSVGFIKTSSGFPELCGSGTLVRCETTQGILTCGHVLDALPSKGDVGIVSFPVTSKKTQRMTFDIGLTYAAATVLHDPNHEVPDIAFLPLTYDTFGSLAASVNCYNLDLGKARWAGAAAPHHNTRYVTAGAVDEMSFPSDEASPKNLSVRGIMNISDHIRERVDFAPYDVCEMLPDPAEDFKMPSSFEGMSGGGFWRLSFGPGEDGEISVESSILMGVCYRQTAAPDRSIVCHGPIDLYGRLLSAIYGR